MLNKKYLLSLLAVSSITLGGLTYGDDALAQIRRPVKPVSAKFTIMKRLAPSARIVLPTSATEKWMGYTFDMSKSVSLRAAVSKPKGYKQALKYRWEISDSPNFAQALVIGTKPTASFVPSTWFPTNQHTDIYVRFIALAGPHSTTDVTKLQYTVKVN